MFFFPLSLQEITLHASLSPGVCGSVVGHQQEVSHLQSGHWDPADPGELIAPVHSCGFRSALLILHRLPPGGGALPNTLPSSCITQRACLLRQLLQRDQQSTLTYNTKRDDRGRGGWCTDTGRSAEWTLLDVNGRECMDRCAEASHDSVRLCTPVHISPYSHKESTNLLAQCGVLGPLFSAKPSPLRLKACEKSFKLRSAQALTQHICTEHCQMTSMGLCGVNSCSWTLVVSRYWLSIYRVTVLCSKSLLRNMFVKKPTKKSEHSLLNHVHRD